jgi:hypothetical protein
MKVLPGSLWVTTWRCATIAPRRPGLCAPLKCGRYEPLMPGAAGHQEWTSVTLRRRRGLRPTIRCT